MEKKKILSICTLLILVIGIIFITFPNHNNKRVNKSNSDNLIRLDNSAISLMIETTVGSGEYELSSMNTWPTKGYIYNEKLSYCENGSELIYDETNGLQLKTTLSDKCYIYYDKETDLLIATTYNGYAGMPIAVGPQVTLSCSGSTATYNNQYNRVEVGEISTQKAKCNLEYTDRTSKTYLNNKIIGLAGTTQGTGQVVHETFTQGNFTNATKLTESQYGTTSQYYNSSYSATSGTTVTDAFTFSNNEWTTNPTNLTNGRAYHLYFTIPSSGAYQLCYEISSGSASNGLFIYQGTLVVPNNGTDVIYASTSASKTGCVDLGYVTANTSYRVVQRAYTTIATLKFSVQKANSTTTVDAGYRYEGKNPNNYIWFNNELWRIIGVFGSTSHGIANTNLVKIIRDESLGGLLWDTANKNDWSTSSLKKLLNPISGDNKSGSYYNKTDGTNSGYCYGALNRISNCDYSNHGIDAAYRQMIKNATWYLGGLPIASIKTEEMYKYERNSNSKISSNKASDTGYVGLMYASDYGYSVLASSCTRTRTLDTYNIAACAGQSWLYGQGNEWAIPHYSNYSSSSFMIHYNGGVSRNNNAYGGNAVRPVLYLDSNVYFISGTGTITDPYIIGM